jgi:hypothetical protein
LTLLQSAHSNIASMAQGPQTPWGNDKELEEEYALDPKAFLLERCESFVKNIKFMQHYVFAATYYLPAFQVVPGGHRIYASEATQAEAIHQGKVGLVIGKGPLAFKDDERVKHHGQDVEIGDWIWWDIHDARQYTISRVHCRFVADVRILGVVNDPRLIY